VLTPEVATPGPGQCLLHRIDGRLFVERADPQILLTQALVMQVRAGQQQDMHLDGDVLVIDGSNQRVSYRLGQADGTGHRLAHLT